MAAVMWVNDTAFHDIAITVRLKTTKFTVIIFCNNYVK